MPNTGPCKTTGKKGKKKKEKQAPLTRLVELGQAKVDGLEGRVLCLRLEQKVLYTEHDPVSSRKRPQTHAEQAGE
jgi:hypothetical protein